MVLTSGPQRDPCARGRVVGGFVTSHSWRTQADLRIGASLTQLRDLHPSTQHDGVGWWRLPSVDLPSGAIPLHAHVSRGHVDRLLLN